MTITVYTAILGGFDYLRAPLVPADGNRYVCYSNGLIDPAGPWEIQPAYAPLPHAGRNSRIPKILAHFHAETEYSIWHDANFQLKQSPAQLIREYLQNHDIAMFKHPCRDTVEREANVLLEKPEEFPTCDMTDVTAQVTRWKHMGAPVGLWCGGLIIRRHTPSVAAFNELWWDEYQRGCSRDQLALPMARAKAGIEIRGIQGNIYDNPLVAFNFHAAWRDKPCNRAYQTRESELKARRARLEELCG